MIVIGVNGSSCAGKTTFSRHLFKDKRRKIIHLDRLFITIKKEFFKNSTISLINTNGEDIVYVNKDTNLSKLVKLKITRKILKEFKKVYSKQIVEYFIKKYNKDYDYLIIEGFRLDELDLEKYCDELIYLYAKEEKRKQRYSTRNKIGRNGFNNQENLLILNSFNNITKYVDFNKYIIVNNNGSRDELKKSIEQLEDLITRNAKPKKKLDKSLINIIK